MLKFARNKVIGVYRRGSDTLAVHGVLDDDIYSVELDVALHSDELRIVSIEGKWHRWTTPECPRAVEFLQGAVGMSMQEEGFGPGIHKVVGRKACRHFANLLLECCHSAAEAAAVLALEEARKNDPQAGVEAFLSPGGGKASRRDGDLSRTPPPSQVGPSLRSLTHPTGREESDGGEDPRREPGRMVIDLHVHTSPASPCSGLSVDEVIEDAKRIGLDGICFTDHNYVWDAAAIEDLRQKHGFLVLRGNEIITDQGDMIVLGLDRDVQGVAALKDLREEVLRADGLMIVPHPFRGFLTFGVGQVGLTPEKAMERPLFKLVDAVEVLNGKVTKDENAFAAKVAKGLGLPSTGGSDAHDTAEVGMYATSFSSVLRNERDLIEALRNGDGTPVVFRRERELG